MVHVLQIFILYLNLENFFVQTKVAPTTISLLPVKEWQIALYSWIPRLLFVLDCPLLAH